ncbi:MAG: 2-oxo acid dehydrogenase subunit E2 [Acidimicrobiales bacterium]
MASITIPSLGIAMSDALLVKWLKQPGEDVAEGDAVAEIETDKALMPLESPVAGKLGPHLFAEEAIVPVGAVIVEVTAEGPDVGRDEVGPARPESVEPAAPSTVPEEKARDLPAPADEARGRHALSPRARRLARERAESTSDEGVPSPGRSERFRELIASKVSRAWQEIPHFSVTREVGGEGILATVGELRSLGTEPVPTVTDLLLRAHALALEECGLSTGDVGLAVGTPFGVVVPVVRNVLGLDARGLARARHDAVRRARAGQLRSEDLEATPPSTLSNLGASGVDSFTGVIALGQTSLLTIGRIKPGVVADGERSFSIRPVFSATLNLDHRAVDGTGAARLLVAFAQAAESMNGTMARM